MNRLLNYAFEGIIKDGVLTVIDATGKARTYGDGSGDNVAIRLCDRSVERDLILDPELKLGQAYMHGRLRIERGTPYDLIALVMRNMAQHPLPAWSRLAGFARRRLRRLAQANPRGRARRNAHHHYDVDPRIYRLFLDRDLQYSCAYFDDPSGSTPSSGDGLEAAQRAKKDHIAAKLNLRAGDRVLDIGCGWGGLALDLAERHHTNVRGITLSDEQLADARERARLRGLSGHVDFALEDYRDTTGTFDRIVSVGMLEHVGPASYRRFFKMIAERMADDGIALIHTIGRSDDAGGITNPFIARYIFPGGYIPALSELAAAIERSGLVIGDIEVLRLHYAETLRRWRHRFAARRDQAAAIAGERFCRMWEFYLAGSEAAFRHQNLVVFQIQLAKRLAAIPVTRDYLYESSVSPGFRPVSRVAWADDAKLERFANTKH